MSTPRTTITDTRMVSDTTTHHAWKVEDGWWVTFLPGTWSRNQAITAMTLAECFDLLYRRGYGMTGGAHPRESRHWPFFCAWSAELGMSAEQVWSELASTYGEDR